MIKMQQHQSIAAYAEITKLLATDRERRYFSVTSIAVSGDGSTLIIGCQNDEKNKGWTFIYVKKEAGWIQQAKLEPIEEKIGDCFGATVDISFDGNTAIVGAYGDDDFRGAAYIFNRSGTIWSQQTKIVSEERTTDDYFGMYVKISHSGDVVAINTEKETGFRNDTYIFVKIGSVWAEEAKLPGSEEIRDNAVSLSGDGSTVVTELWEDTDDICIFNREGDTWSLQSKITLPPALSGHNNGHSIVISADGSTIAIGSYRHDSFKGAVYVFTKVKNEWVLQAKIAAADGAEGDRLGLSVSISSDGNTIAAGSHWRDSGKGAAYIFTREQGVWSEKTKLMGTDREKGIAFGGRISMCADGSSIIVGQGLFTHKGAVYVFEQTKGK